ncbi:hypothetical protein [Aeromonas sp.]|uniref:hypothetical protein n=1 Tax=Aeromonas sp. TaxID=647 RepID=UPI0029122DF4|nr:hypothetical protein [Aeromonas sp.]MDU7582392.1 hypothetical protein [Aeromonas sp.]
MRSIKQDGVERTINAIDGIVVWVIGRLVSGSFEVVTKDAETLAYLDGGAPQQSLFKLLGINLVITSLGDGLLQQLAGGAKRWRSFSRVSSRE